MSSSPRLHSFSAPNPEGKGAHTIAWVEWGDPDNPETLFCVHGLTRNAHDFDYFAQELSRDFRVLCPDMAGRGESEWLPDPAGYNYPTYTMDCLALLDHLGVEQCRWVGTSMGGIIGMTIAALYAGRITRMVMNDIGAFIPAAGLNRILRYAGKAPRFSHRAEAEEYLRDICAPFGISEAEHWKHFFAHSIREKDGNFILNYDPAIRASLPDPENDTVENINLFELWEAVDIPVLVLRGAESDLLSREVVEEMKMGHWGVEMLEIPATGHAPHLMSPEQIQPVKQWLKA